MRFDPFILFFNQVNTVGAVDDFNQDIIEPPLESAKKIFVSKENDFIYVLDSKNSRIVLFDKDGRFLEQYKAKNLGSIKDFIVDETNKTIYILSDNKVYLMKIK